MPSLSKLLPKYIYAAFPGIWLETQEPEEAERELLQLSHQEGWRCVTWDLARGLQGMGALPTAPDPLSVLKVLGTLAEPQGTTLLVLHHYHRFLNSPEIIQTLLHELQQGKIRRTFIVILAPIVQLPPELQKSFVLLTHELPDREQLRQIAQEVQQDDVDIPAAVLDAAAGLTRAEAENAFALSLLQVDQLQPAIIWEYKASSLKQQNLLSLQQGSESFNSLGGLSALKDFCSKALEPGRTVKPRGTLLLSPPGCGKSAFCRALQQEVGRPVLSLDLGNLYGSLVGETEKNIRKALQIADAMAPCILFVDELEKGLAGVQGTGDSGVSTRLFGTLLTWLADHTSDVFFIGTANKIDQLPPEFTRAERLDAIFFIDLPGSAQRQEIWKLARKLYDIPAMETQPDDEGWTGAEIKACCRLAALLGTTLEEAAMLVVPVSKTAAESLQNLRNWSQGRCLDAELGGIYGGLRNIQPTCKRRKTVTAELN